MALVLQNIHCWGASAWCSWFAEVAAHALHGGMGESRRRRTTGGSAGAVAGARAVPAAVCALLFVAARGCGNHGQQRCSWQGVESCHGWRGCQSPQPRPQGAVAVGGTSWQGSGCMLE
jgi:hypothetical protein